MNKTNNRRINGLVLAMTLCVSTALASSAFPSGGADFGNSRDNKLCSARVQEQPVQLVPPGQSSQPSNLIFRKPIQKDSSAAQSLDETYRKSGDMKLSDGDFTGALDEYDKALQVNSKNAMAYYGRGRVRLATSDYSEARIDLNRALTIDSNLTAARLALIGILMYTRDFASGISEATKVIESDPKNALAYYERGICDGEVGRRTDAINDLSEAKVLLLADGDQVGCDFVNFSLGKQYQENGRYAAYQKDYETALKDFDAALSINSSSAATLIAKASVEAEMGSKEAALADYNKAIEVAPLLADAYKQRGNYYMQTASYQLAQEDFTRALAINPSDPDLYNSRGRTYEALGNMDNANADYKQAQVVAKTQTKQETEQLTKAITDLVQKV